MRIPINLVFEDELGEYVLSRLLDCYGGKYSTGISYNGRGFGYIKSKINGFNQACAAVPFLVLTDLDNNDCPVTLIDEWFIGQPHRNMIFRIAIREVEAWLLADKEGLANYLGIPEVLLPINPEQDPDPKKTLISLTRRSKHRKIREDIIPINENASIGPNYNGRLMEFVFNHWSIKRAMTRSESLRRAHKKLDLFQFAIS